MLQSPHCHATNASPSKREGFTIIEVLVAVSIAGGVITMLVPALLRQVTLGEQTNRLTAVEAAVSRDLNWFKNHAKLWKLKAGSYPPIITDTLTGYSDVTQTKYTTEAAAIYEPTSADCQNLASNLLTAASTISSAGNQSPNPIGATKIEVIGQGFNTMEVFRNVTPMGKKIHLSYALLNVNSNGLAFRREASVLVEAGAWCDVLP